jgi:hypothetical protein
MRDVTHTSLYFRHKTRRFTFNYTDSLSRHTAHTQWYACKSTCRDNGTFLIKCSNPKFWRHSTIFWDMTPCSLLDAYRRFGGKHCLFTVKDKPSTQKASNKPNDSLFGLLDHLEDGVITLSETANFYHTMWRHIPKDDTVHIQTKRKSSLSDAQE